MAGTRYMYLCSLALNDVTGNMPNQSIDAERMQDTGCGLPRTFPGPIPLGGIL